MRPGVPPWSQHTPHAVADTASPTFQNPLHTLPCPFPARLSHRLSRGKPTTGGQGTGLLYLGAQPPAQGLAWGWWQRALALPKLSPSPNKGLAHPLGGSVLGARAAVSGNPGNGVLQAPHLAGKAGWDGGPGRMRARAPGRLGAGQGWDPGVLRGQPGGEASKSLKTELRICRRNENLPPCCVTLDPRLNLSEPFLICSTGTKSHLPHGVAGGVNKMKSWARAQ